MKRLLAGTAAAAGFIGSVVGANWAINRFGVVPVGFGFAAPAGVYFAGVAFSLRDALQRTLGARWVPVAVVAGALVSAAISPALALASGAAFAISELADFAVYTPLVKRNAIAAVVASNIVGAALDSYVFLAIIHRLAFFDGQVIGKLEMTAPVVLAMAAYRVRKGRDGRMAGSTSRA